MNGISSGQDELDRNKQLMLLMTQHQRRIFSYIYTLVPYRHDAEDLLQETSKVICEKFDEFKEGTGERAVSTTMAMVRVITK